MTVLAAVLDGVALRPLEHILKYIVSADYVYDFSRVLLGALFNVQVGNANHVRNKTKKIVSGIEKVQCDL
jgi:hypothetical protein